MENLQETVERLKSFQGNVKGEVFRTHADYIRSKQGEEGLKTLEERMNQLGAPINFKEVKSFEWVNEGLSSLVLVVAKDTFNWTDEDIIEMGRFATKFSFIIKVMIQYLVSVEALLKNAAKYWDKHFDFGSLETEYDKENNLVTITEKGDTPHKLSCLYHKGYFQGLLEFVVKGKEVSVKEIECIHEGGEYNRFLIKW